ncbi:hypothetical protein BURKHO8Y_520019 [Burkholderia sp. 8Y]|nr:hypothetical protein BURKHO8Y_520019 [Burkholderia sp. 8Y]
MVCFLSKVYAGFYVCLLVVSLNLFDKMTSSTRPKAKRTSK